MYSSSYSSLRRLGLNTSSHNEPKMSQTEWRYAFNRPANQSVRPKSNPAVSRTISRTAVNPSNQPSTVQSMLDAARQRQRSLQSDQSVNQAATRSASRSSVDEVSDDEDPIGQATRADRRVAEMRRKHQSDRQAQSKLDRTKRRRTQSNPDDTIPDQSSTPTLTQSSDQPRQNKRRKTQEIKQSLNPSADHDTHNWSEISTITAPRIDVSETISPRDRIRSSLLASINQARPSNHESKQSSHNSSSDSSNQSIADSIEDALFQLYGSTDRAYRQHARDLSFSLVQNPSLVNRLLAKADESSDQLLTPSEIVQMPIADLAPQSIIEQRQMDRESTWNEQITKQTIGTSTSEYSCPNCKSNECEFWTLKEGRDMRKAEIWGGGGDDSASVYLIRCSACSHSWKKEV